MAEKEEEGKGKINITMGDWEIEKQLSGGSLLKILLRCEDRVYPQTANVEDYLDEIKRKSIQKLWRKDVEKKERARLQPAGANEAKIARIVKEGNKI